MSKLKLKKNPNPILRKKTNKVKEPLSEEIQNLIPEMIEVMKEEKGIGLAANQVGKSLRLCVIQDRGEVFVLINPMIKSRSRKKIIMEEGCLSIPGKIFSVPRHEKVKVRYLDEKGKKSKIKAGGLLSQALQHEIDHLDGILVIDRVKKEK